MKTNRLASVGVYAIIAAGCCGFVLLHYSPQLALGSQARPGAGEDFNICFPAAQMAPNAIFFKTSFIQNYLNPRNPYPVFTAMYQAGVAPESKTDEANLGKRGPFVFAAPTTMLNDASNLGICGGNPSICNSATFAFQLGGSTSTVKVDFAPKMSISVTNSSALAFDFGAGVPIHFQNPGAVIPVLRPDMLLTRIAIADQYLDEVLTSVPGQGTPLTVTLHLALNGACPASPIRTKGPK